MTNSTKKPKKNPRQNITADEATMEKARKIAEEISGSTNASLGFRIAVKAYQLNKGET